ncbi:MAG TPA: BTAD domain-containing putative transcriptional regulator [Actinophytocola sp.]|jgi:DNA-binding SARP family transcriptional activator|nr:BTAD domain-containing putative transcriptional regulator [Actinophytocola sp.]
MTYAVVVGAARGVLPGTGREARARQAEPAAAREIMVEFRALGPVEAVAAGRLVDLGAPKQRALLALLVSQAGQPVAVDVLLEALWAGRPPPSAVTSLQAYVANLRRALEPDRAPRTPATVLRTCPGGYLLDSRVVDVDVHRFGERAKAGWQAGDRGDAHEALAEFEAGLALWRGQAYAEVADATCVVPEVARLDELRLSVVEARCAALLAVGAHGVAVAELEAFIQAHPLREYGYELLSLALYRAGRQADALGVLRTVQKKLAEELGIDPRPALQTLEREILNQDPALDWHPTPAAPTLTVPTAPPRAAAADLPASPVPDGEVFVGREAALRQLTEALAAAGAGRGRVVTVSGEPGIGKTSLLRRFADLAGVPVLWGTCPEHVAAPPLWLWEQVLRAAGSRFPQRPVPPQVAELIDGETGQPADGGDMLRRFEAIVHYLTGASPAAPLVVLLDHLHRADPSSLRLLAHLAESVPASRLLLAVSYRSGEEESLAETLAALGRAGITRIALDGLDVADTHTLANALLDKEIGRATAEGLRARTEGNPFFLRELTKLLTTEQRLARPDTVPVPVAVRDVVLRRVARLPHAAAEVLSVAAVAGRQFDIEVVAQAASVELEAALEVLDTAVAAGVVVEDQQRLGWFRFTHTLVVEALYETTGRLRRARLHRRIGATAARAWAGNAERTAEIARHWLLAAELDPTAAAHACTHAAAAARAADARRAPAAALWRQALAAADLAENDELDRYPLLIGLGSSLYRAGNARDGLPHFVQAIAETLVAQSVRHDPDASRLVAAAVAAVRGPDWYPGEHAGPRLAGVLERALPVVTDPGQRALVLSCLAVARYHELDPVGRAALSDEAVALAAGTAAPAEILHLRAAALAGPDHLDECLRAVTELLALPDVPTWTVGRARRLRAQALLTMGRVAEATAELDLAAGPADERCAPLRTQLDWSRAAFLLVAGRLREAGELSRAAHDRHARMSWGAPRVTRAVQRWEAAFLGRADLAGLADELRAVVESGGPLHGILALALTEAGRMPDARLVLGRIPLAHKDYQWLHARCWALLAATRLDDTETVARLRAELLPYRRLTSSVQDVVISGPVAYFTAEAALALRDPDAAAVDLAVAADTARLMGSRPWLAVVREAVSRCARSGAALTRLPAAPFSPHAGRQPLLSTSRSATASTPANQGE